MTYENGIIDHTNYSLAQSRYTVISSETDYREYRYTRGRRLGLCLGSRVTPCQLAEEAPLGQFLLRFEVAEAAEVGVVGDLAVLCDRLGLDLSLKLRWNDN